LPDGRTILERTWETLKAAGCSRTLIAANDARPFPGWETVADPPGFERAGPLAGVVAGLGRLVDEAETGPVLVVAGDMPDLVPALLAALLARVTEACLAVVPVRDHRLEPLCACYLPGAHGPLQSSLSAGERALHRAVLALPGLIRVDAEWLRSYDQDLRSFHNVNEPSDWQ
jgi:molybdopterin-guanine dinucleotide biosynthesis protein A